VRIVPLLAAAIFFIAILILDACRSLPPESSCRACDADTEESAAACGEERCAVLDNRAACRRLCRDDRDCHPLESCRRNVGLCVPVSSDCGAPAPPDALSTSHTAPPAGTIPDARTAGGRVQVRNHADGALMSRLHFAVVGDTRPPLIDDTDAYPTAVVHRIFAALEREQPRPAFAVATGDYLYADPTGDEADRQLQLYTAAREAWTGPLYPAMGNHECTGPTRANCELSDVAINRNLQAFSQRLLRPAGLDRPWYRKRLDALDGRWSAQLVVTAPNAWSRQQAQWLEQTLQQPATYTLVVRHEPRDEGDDLAPGARELDALLDRYPPTLVLTGHRHLWQWRPEQREVVVGNGGAPLTGRTPHGYTLISQRDDGALVITGYALEDGRALDGVVIGADGREVR